MILAKIIFFAPLIAAIIAGLNTRRLSYKTAQLITCGLVSIAAICALAVFKDVAIGGNIYNIKLISWIYSGSFQADWAIKVDALTAVMFVVVTGVSALVHIYSVGYMHEDPFKQRFMAYLSLFTFFMLVLVTANNFIQMFVGWEGVGLCSYLLIGFWYKKASASAAAIKAFVVNRIGDFGLVLGVAGVYLLFGSVSFDTVFAAAPSKAEIYWSIGGAQIHALTLICIFLFIGAMGKSAQFGLHTWLPDAMEGPTPVSALIHAATMVTAGVFMLARCSYLFEYAPVALQFVTFIGAVTAIFAATIAITQNDIKKVIAYSTCSQLGYMVFVCGLSAYSAGIFHLATHAFFKALLFLSAGSVIHAMHHEQDMQKMGGLRTKIPFTYAMMAVGSLAIIGTPLLAGFYSKEAILGIAYHGNSTVAGFAFWMGALTALLTAFYSARLFFLTFHGAARDKKAVSHAHESPKVMLAPLFILALGAAFSGYYGAEILEVLNPNGEFWKTAIFVNMAQHNPLAHIHPPEWIVPLSMFAALVGGVLYGSKLHVAKILAKKFRPLYLLSYNKWYVDEIYDAVFVKPYAKISGYFWKTVDTKFVDGMPNGAASLTMRAAKLFSKFQTGYIFQYAFVMIFSIALIITAYMLYIIFEVK